jgi:hypothetical protein
MERGRARLTIVSLRRPQPGSSWVVPRVEPEHSTQDASEERKTPNGWQNTPRVMGHLLPAERIVRMRHAGASECSRAPPVRWHTKRQSVP